MWGSWRSAVEFHNLLYLIASRKEGKYVYYRLENPAVLAVMQTLYGIFCAPGGIDDRN